MVSKRPQNSSVCRGVHHTASRRRPRRPYNRTPLAVVCSSANVSNGQHWAATSLLFLHQHRPTQALLEAPQTPVPFTTGEQNPRTAHSRELEQGGEAGLRQRRAVHEHRFRIDIQPPGAAALTIAVGRKQPDRHAVAAAADRPQVWWSSPLVQTTDQTTSLKLRCPNRP